MGHHLGHHDHVLHILRLLEDRRHGRVPYSLGCPDGTGHPALHRHVLPARITPVAGAQGSLGGMPRRAYARPR